MRLTKELEGWQNQLAEVYTNFPRLLFLCQRQLSQFMLSVKALCVAREQGLPAKRRLLPFLTLCYPDVVTWDSHAEQTAAWEGCVRALLVDTEGNQSYLSTVYTQLPPAPDAAVYLATAGQLVRQLQEMLETKDSIDLDQRPQRKMPIVVNACGYNGWDMFRLALTLDANPLHPSQVTPLVFLFVGSSYSNFVDSQLQSRNQRR